MRTYEGSIVGMRVQMLGQFSLSVEGLSTSGIGAWDCLAVRREGH